MAGTINSLGIGSGVLTADIVDQLKAADEAAMIAPLDKKLDLNQQKQQSYDLLYSYTSMLKSATSSLSDSTLFANRTVDVLGDAKASVTAGVKPQTFTLETTTLAKKDITKLGAVTSRENSIASNTGTLQLSINGTDYNIEYDGATTLESLAQSINDTTNGEIEASILETSPGLYSMVISSAATGADQAITINDVDGNLDSALFDTAVADDGTGGYEKMQDSVDAEFKYNGITMTRPTNEIDDITLGLTLTLTKEGDYSTINIKQDTSKVSDEMQNFVDNYNQLMSNLDDMTTYNEDTGAVGVFQGESFANGLKRDLSSMVTNYFGDESLIDYGISVNEDGVMSFDRSAFESKLNEDPDKVEKFFSGEDGYFTAFNDRLDTYTRTDGMLANFDTGLTNEQKSLEASKERSQEMLDAKYDTMMQRFAAYDAMISQMNNSYSSLQMMIDQAANANN